MRWTHRRLEKQFLGVTALSISLYRLLTPGKLILLPVLLSCTFWILPGESLYLRGFGERAEVNLGGVLLLTAFYSTVVVLAGVFAALGRSAVPLENVARARAAPVERRFYLLISSCSLLGVVAAYYAAGSSVSIYVALTTSTGNTLSESLSDGSSLATLRYATAISAPVGIYLWRKGQASFVMAVANCILLILNALLTSRLSLVMAVVVYFFLLAQEMPQPRPRHLTLGIFGIGIFAVFTVFNYVRNGNYYRLFGVEDPILMNIYQILTYVGAPSQVSLGVASSIANGQFDKTSTVESAIDAIVPTFWQDGKTSKSVATDLATYGYSVDIAPNLNTNSAFADTYAKYGWYGLAAILIAICSASLLFGIFSRIGGVYAAGAGVIGYGFAEFWRLFLFNQGILVFLVALTAVGAILAMATTIEKNTHSGMKYPMIRKFP